MFITRWLKVIGKDNIRRKKIVEELVAKESDRLQFVVTIALPANLRNYSSFQKEKPVRQPREIEMMK